MTTMSVVGECFFWYRLTRVVPDNFHRAVKRLCVCVCVLSVWARCRFAYGPANAIASHYLLLQFTLTRVVLDKRPSNGCCCCIDNDKCSHIIRNIKYLLLKTNENAELKGRIQNWITSLTKKSTFMLTKNAHFIFTMNHMSFLICISSMKFLEFSSSGRMIWMVVDGGSR